MSFDLLGGMGGAKMSLRFFKCLKVSYLADARFVN